ncbi:MAG: cysteine hydrolase [Alphaproteobacteria bacterium]|nr:cysteine hydrolase [Alphaproteobacteria bacterium]
MEASRYPRDVVERVMRRRGRLHAYEAVDPRKTVLLAVDLQIHFMREGSAAEIAAARAVVPNVNRLAAELRARGSHVVWVISTYGPDPKDRWSNFFDNVAGPETGEHFRRELSEGSDGHAIWPDLDVLAADPIISKNRFGGFTGSGGVLEQTLRDLGADTVLVVGTVTNVCCEDTAREAATRDFKTIMVSDAIGGRSNEEDIETYSVFIAAYGDVMSTDDVIGRLTDHA